MSNSQYTRFPEIAGGGGMVNSVTASAPLISSGGANPNISLGSQLLNVQQLYVSPFGSDVTGDGSIVNPYQTILFAQNTFSNEAVSTVLGPQRNPAVSYVITLSEGTFLEDPSWSPKLYVNYIGAGQDATFIAHNDSSPIVFNYGDNYGDGMAFIGINFNAGSQLRVIRTAGYNDLSTQPNLWEIDFDDCNVSRMIFQGSGFDAGPFLAGGFPAVNLDRVVLNGCTARGNVNVHAVQTEFSNSNLGNIIMDYVGVDGSIPYSGAYVNTWSNCFGGRFDLKNYILLNLYNCHKANVRLFGLNPDTTFNEIFGPNPFGFLDADSMSGGFAFLSNAIPEQIQMATTLTNLAQNLNNTLVSGTYVSITDNNMLADTSGGPVDITLAPAVNFGRQDVSDVKNNASINTITIHPTSLDIMMENGSPVASTTITTNGASKHFLFTSDGSGGGSPQVSDIKTVADVAGNLAGKYLQIYSVTGIPVGPGLPPQTIQFVPWFRVSGSGTAPVVSDATIFPVDINTNDSADAVAAALLAALQQQQISGTPNWGSGNFSDFEPGGLSNEITQTNFVNGAPPANTDGGTGFVLSTTTPGAYDLNGTVWVIS